MKNKEQAGQIDRNAGARLRAIRNSRKMSQTALGDAIGITFQQVQKYERGSNRMAVSTIHAICKALNCAITDIIPPLGGEPSPVSFDMIADQRALQAALNQIARTAQSALRATH